MGDLRPRSRASLTGITASVYNFGGFAGSVGMGLAIALYGWRLGLGGLSILGLVYLPIMFLFMGSASDSQKSEKGVSSSLSYYTLLKSKNTLFAGASLFMAMYASFAIVSWTPTYLTHFGVDSSVAGVVVGAFSLAGGVTAIMSGRLADAWGEKRLILATGTTAGILSVLLFPYNLDFTLMIALIISLGFLVWPSWNLITSMVQRLVDSASVGSMTGLVQTFGMLGGFLGPVVTGVLVKYYGIGSAMLGSAAISLCLYALLIVPFREVSKH